jgi:hypothetical protein
MKAIDKNAARWGEVPVPLLPRSLRMLWRADVLPAWLSEELRLQAGATYLSLDSSVWRSTATVPSRVLNVLVNLLRVRLAEVKDAHVVDPSIRDDTVSLVDAALSTRAHNALRQAGLLSRPLELNDQTFGGLLRVDRLGVKSALEIACILEFRMTERAEAMNEIARLVSEDDAPDWAPALAQIATKPWAACVSERDARFRGLLPSDVNGTVAERIEQVLEKPDSISSVSWGPELVAAALKVEQEVERIKHLTLDEALNQLLAASSRGRQNQLEALAMRFGWSGSPPRTLEEAARPLGVTRERVRQIESRFTHELPEHVYLPQLDVAIDLLEDHAPLSKQAAQELLTSAGVTKAPVSAQAIIATAKLFRRETNLRIEEVRNGGEVLVGSKSSARSAAAAARKLAGRAGVASVFQVASELGLETSKVNETHRLLRALSHVEFISEDWFWVTDIPKGRNRLSNVAKRILSVAAPQSVQSIREGVRRAFTHRSKSSARYEALLTPPSDVLVAYFRQSPEFVLLDMLVSPAAALAYAEELGDIDRTLVEVFRSTATGVLDRRAVLDACKKRGLNENSVSIFLTYSPIIEHVGPDIWKLRGVGVDPVAIEALREANASILPERRLLSFGWRPNGRLWIAARLPYSLASVVLGLPGAIKRYLVDRRFVAVDQVSGAKCGQIGVNEGGTSFGYSTFFRVASAEPGDVMVAEFDLASESVYLSLTDDSALDADRPDLIA